MHGRHATATTCCATPWHADRVVERYEETGADYITCVGLPFGTAPTGYSLASLERICALKSDANTEGQGRFFADERIASRADGRDGRGRAPRDRADDARLPRGPRVLRGVAGGLEPYEGPPSLARIVATLHARPDIVAINAALQEEYWRRFNARYKPVELA